MRKPLHEMEDIELPDSSQAQSIHQRSHVSQKKQNKFFIHKPEQEMDDTELPETSLAKSIRHRSHVS